MSDIDGRRIRFAAFEVDLVAGELRKSGKRLPLQEQPFQILAALLEHPGEVVTREYLRERLWPGQTFVDFDQGLNTAINKLRDALGDSAANPRFIETVPRRGYRFTFTLEIQPDPGQVAARPPVPVLTQPGALWRGPRPWLAIATLGLAGMGAWLWLRPAHVEFQTPLRRFVLRTPIVTATAPYSRAAAISPDGKHVVFIGRQNSSRLWIQRFDQEEPTALEGSEEASDPFWSPDSKHVGFAVSPRAALMRVPVAGGIPTRICEIQEFFSGGTWSPDGNTIVFGSGGPGILREVPAAGGIPKVIVTRDQFKLLPTASELAAKALFLHTPHFLPMRGRRVVVFEVGWTEANIAVRDLDTGRTEILGPGTLPVYSPSGHLVFQSTASGDLWAQPFSMDTLKTTGPGFVIERRGLQPSVALDGTLVYVDPPSQRLVWVDRRGQRASEAGPTAFSIFYPTISPDGRRVAVEARETENLDIWVYDLVRGAKTRLSFDPATEVLPVWSPDGEQVAYSSWRNGNTDIFVRRADAGTEEKTLVATPAHERVSDWSRDGKYILYSREDPKTSSDLWYLKRNDAGEWEPSAFLQTRFRERVAKFSPDGRYVAYLSDESGRDELYVRPFPPADSRWVISRNGASQPRWARSGRELFYLEAGMLMAVPVRTTPEFSAGTPVPLFAHPGLRNFSDPNYDISADGERFLVPERFGSEQFIHVVQNWFAEFRTRH